MKSVLSVFSVAFAAATTILALRMEARAADARANGFTFRRVDAPFSGVTETQANGINDRGQVVGFYVVGGATHGYIDDRGSFTHRRRLLSRRD